MVRLFKRPFRQQGGKRVADDKTRVAPVGGWNVRDPKESMPPEDAVRLVNWFPRERDVVTRPGYSVHCDLGTNEPVGSIFEFEYYPYHKGIAASGGKVFDVTVVDTPVELADGFTSDTFVSASLAGRLFIANGLDVMSVFNGTALSAHTFTGTFSNPFSFVHTHKKRIYLVERGTQKLHYGSPGAISGATNVFDLSTTGGFGGELAITCTLSASGGKGPQDVFVAIFTSGDVVVYEGDDPGASNWAEVGKFKIGRPLSRRGVLPLGNDVIILTERGYESLRIALPLGLAQPRMKMLSDKIGTAVTDAVKEHPLSDEWQVALYPLGEMLIVQVPGSATQHVRNFTTGAWCEFASLDATAWGNFGVRCFFGNARGQICEFDTSPNDNGIPIRSDAITAWDSMGLRSSNKLHTLQRLELESMSMTTIRLSLGVDFVLPPVGGEVYISDKIPLAKWNVANWNRDYWTMGLRAFQVWCKLGNLGRFSALRVVTQVDDSPISWNATTYLYKVGGLL